MTKQTINIGQTANDKKGDSLRAAFQKVNANFNELYLALGLDDGGLNLGSFKFEGSTLSTSDSSSITIAQSLNVTSNLNLSADILPDASNRYELGSRQQSWYRLWLGTTPLSINDQGKLLLGSDAVVTESSVFSGSYNDLTNKPVIPTVPSNVSAFNNDIGYITQADIAGGNLTIDLATTGTVIADILGEDSTLLVDSQNSKITGPVDTTTVENSSGNLNLRSSDNITLSLGGNAYQWSFDDQGRLVVPANGDIVRNGVSFSSVNNLVNAEDDLALPNGILFPGLRRFQIVNSPSTLEGSPGDTPGMLAFDANKIYYCKEPYTRQGSTTVTIDGLSYSSNLIRILTSSVTPQPGWILSDDNFSTTILSVVPENGGYSVICDQQAPQDPWRTGDPYNVTLTDDVPDSGNIWVSQNWLTDLDLLEIVNETIKTINNNIPIELQTQGADSTVHRWKFDAEGVLTLPNGTRVNEKTIITAGSLRDTVEFSPAGISEVTQAIRVYPSNPTGESNVHISSGDLSATAFLIGSEDQYFKISTTGDVEAKAKDNQNLKITVSSTSNSITTPKEWNFTSDGGLRFPDNTTQTTAFSAVSYRNLLIVDPNGNDASADGSYSRPFATIQAAHNYAQNNIPAANDAVIQVNPGAYSENITITRVKTHIIGNSPGSSLSTTITGRILINVSTGNQGVTNDTITLERLQIVNNIDNVLILGGVQRYTFIGKNLDITNGGNSLRAVSITNTNSSGIAIQFEDCVIDNTSSSDTAVYMSSVFDGRLHNVRVSSGSGPAMDIVNSSIAISDSDIRTTGNANTINVTSSFGTAYNPLTAPNGSIALTARNISLSSSTANGNGINLAANTAVSITDSKFRVPSGSGRAIAGATGSYLIVSGIHFHPSSNSTVSQDITTVNNTTYVGTVSRLVFSDNTVQTTAYTGGGGGADLSSIDSSIVPDTDEAYDLGSATYKFRDLYLSGNTIYLGGTALSVDQQGNLLVGGTAIADVGTAAWNNITGKPAFSTVATSGSYDDLTDRPDIPRDLRDLSDTSGLLVSGGWNLAADDSTERRISNNETVVFFGSRNIETSSDEEGNLTITGSANLSEITTITGTPNDYLYLRSVNPDETAISTNIAVDSINGVRNTFYGSNIFGSQAEPATVNFTNATVTGLGIPTLGNFSFSANDITASSGAAPILLKIFGGDAADPPALINREWSFNTDGSITFPNGAVIKDNADSSVSFGGGAGATNQGAGAVAIGEGAGNNTQSNQAVAIGRGSGNYQQGVGAVGIGFCAGATEQGDYAVAIGFKAARGNMDNDGTPNQPANSIMINASSTPLNGNQAGLYINPVREDTGNIAKAVYYNTTTKELTYADPTGGGGGGGDSLLSDNADITITIENAVTPENTLTWTFATDGLLDLPSGGVIGDIFNSGMTGIQADPTVPDAYASLVSGDKQQAVDATNDEVIIWADDDAQGGTLTKQWKFNRAGEMVFPDATVQTTAFTLSPTVNVLTIEDGVHEKFAPIADATGVVTHDYSTGHIFYHTSPDANWTMNLTNLNLASGYATTVTIIIEQGETGFYPSALQIGGAAQTINWQGNTLPTPSTSRTDVVTFSIFNNSGTYTVLGQLAGF